MRLRRTLLHRRAPLRAAPPYPNLGAEGYSTRHRQRRLASLSLVCPTWRGVAQSLLWRHLTFASSKAARRFLEIDVKDEYTTRSLTVQAPRSENVRGRVTADLVEKLVERCQPEQLNLDELAGSVLGSPGLAGEWTAPVKNGDILE